MGTEWYIIDDQSREFFDLGKGPWRSDLALLSSKESVMRTILNGWSHLIQVNDNLRKGSSNDRKSAKNGISFEYCVWLGDRIWSWCDGRSKLRIETDDSSFDERYGTQDEDDPNTKGPDVYTETGTRYLDIDFDKYVLEKYGPGLRDVFEVMIS